MKYIENIYSIRYSEITYIEDDFGERVGLKTDKEVFELNYDHCMNVYVSLSEDGIDCTYEPVEEAINNSIRALDQVFDYEISKLVQATLENKFDVISHLYIEIKTIKSCLEIIFQQTKVFPYDIEERYSEFYNYHLEKQKFKKSSCK
jgi:hypothetical protein